MKVTVTLTIDSDTVESAVDALSIPSGVSWVATVDPDEHARGMVPENMQEVGGRTEPMYQTAYVLVMALTDIAKATHEAGDAGLMAEALRETAVAMHAVVKEDLIACDDGMPLTHGGMLASLAGISQFLSLWLQHVSEACTCPSKVVH